ncbi:Glycosyl transferase family 2 [Bosea lupini]|uniref:Glycosyl transferase family 2 n=1 Tax=Bosea lupini TaxID=1036779 RepID=A0A1H7TDL7_9HYPH|nr:glycosyltransferase [Bosea lupini]SEL82619.1 Glycosyl transferase family 2 [Bosea lupini]
MRSRAKERAPAAADPTAGAPFCICVPARNEEERLPRLLRALAEQDVEGSVPVAICINNTTDASNEVVAAVGERYRGRLRLSVDVVEFPPDLAHAGSARASALAAGGKRVVPADGVLITTDADARPPANWVSANLAAIAAGADIVGGRLVLDEDERIPPGIAASRELWDRYWIAVRAIEDEIDPCPWDPPPRHGDHTGGSLAITCEMYRRSGGVPLMASGEDRALVEAAIVGGGRLVHPLDVWTRVSARLDGRATHGMAETMRRMIDAASGGAAEMVPALRHWRERAKWRRETRRAICSASRLIAAEHALPPMPHDAVLAEIDWVGASGSDAGTIR